MFSKNSTGLFTCYLDFQCSFVCVLGVETKVNNNPAALSRLIARCKLVSCSRASCFLFILYVNKENTYVIVVQQQLFVLFIYTCLTFFINITCIIEHYTSPQASSEHNGIGSALHKGPLNLPASLVA